MLLKVEMEKGRFYVSRHDAKLSTGVLHDGRSAGMVREEGSELLRYLTCNGTRLTYGASSEHNLILHWSPRLG